MNLFTWEKDILKYVLQIAVSTYVVLLPAATWSNLAFLNNAVPGFRSDFPLKKGWCRSEYVKRHARILKYFSKKMKFHGEHMFFDC